MFILTKDTEDFQLGSSTHLPPFANPLALADWHPLPHSICTLRSSQVAHMLHDECPSCLSTRIKVWREDDFWFARCESCGHEGPRMRDAHEANEKFVADGPNARIIAEAGWLTLLLIAVGALLLLAVLDWFEGNI
ncbi:MULTISPECIES: hypothetical protein [unclassified Sphingobium]|uniref:hypothetical protein n=1 Tax=unclassified Sphingobium TaxID=2611147 RepID=UPI002224CA39|nr:MULTISPECIES: hypothetical protein [unclassified Sphingobium]MCW2396181.1 Zn ribbon nucleic-acid-binding protein [Sphingobium sp. B8D3B]MCW2419697.1 Zn ribbon nucleic-acid-binding protein [Sphingobium sp. B8D3C]